MLQSFLQDAMLCYAKSLQSCPTPSDPMDCSLPGSSVHGIFQAGVLEWGAIAFSFLQDGVVLFYILLILCIFKEKATLRLYKGIYLSLKKWLTFLFELEHRKKESWSGRKEKSKLGRCGEGWIGWFLKLVYCSLAYLLSHFSVPSSGTPRSVTHESWPKSMRQLLRSCRTWYPAQGREKEFIISGCGSGCLPLCRKGLSFVGFCRQLLRSSWCVA